ncbi:thaumatin family protein [Streptomyces herbicida]|uniref:thaumatin family protein n=1 Tax=Streptomyces herbicida TaxID=3065675 RepID=UPI002930B581|nr:thaumatin family protein [Streptomyces sp. NEAU-HV9]
MKRFRELFLAAVLCLTPVVAAAGVAHTAVADESRAAPTAVTSSEAGAAADPHTVTFVNRSGKKLWIGSTVNKGEPDGNSKNLKTLPMLRPGQSAIVTIPENTAPHHWRGKFFARQGCSGKSGSTFHCAVGDCGKFARRCVTGEQPVSLAEFNFDKKDRDAPWYDVSYVNAFSLPVTIAPKRAEKVTENGPCSKQGCKKNLLPYCPKADRVHNSAGKVVLCVNPSRDTPSAYSNAVKERCPKAYAWSKQDTETGNRTMRQCHKCNGFVVTFW